MGRGLWGGSGVAGRFAGGLTLGGSHQLLQLGDGTRCQPAVGARVTYEGLVALGPIVIAELCAGHQLGEGPGVVDFDAEIGVACSWVGFDGFRGVSGR